MNRNKTMKKTVRKITIKVYEEIVATDTFELAVKMNSLRFREPDNTEIEWSEGTPYLISYI